MAITTLALWSLTIFLLLRYVKRRLFDGQGATSIQQTPLNGPDRGSLSEWFIGLLVKLQIHPDPFLYFKECKAKYGPAFEVPGPLATKRIVICDPKAMAHFYGKDTWQYQQPEMSRIFLSNLFGDGLLSSEAESHRRQRKALTPAFSVAQIRELTNIFYDAAYKLKGHWDAKLDGTSDGSVVLDVEKWMNNASLDCIGIAGFGHDFHGLDGEYTVIPELFDAFADQERNSYFSNFVLIASPWLPILQELPTALNKVLKNVKTGLGKIADDLLEKTKQENEAAEKSLIGLLIRAEGSSDTFGITQEEVLAQMNLLLLAGYETTAISLTWSLIELSRFPEKQERLRKELIQFSNGSDPSYDSLSSAGSLPYLDAVVHEILRLHPPVMETTRLATEDDIIPFLHPITTATGEKVDRLTVKKGSVVTSPIIWMNRCEEFWGPRANEFVPERWLDAEDPDKKREPGLEVANEIQGYHHVLTFSDGPRTCLGKNFALAEFKTVLSVLIRHFVFEFPDGPKTVLEKHPSLLPRPKVKGAKGPEIPLRIRRVELYLGSSTGNLHVYSLNDTQEGSEEHVLLEVKKALVRRSITQLGFIRDVNSLVVLSEMAVTLFPLPGYAPPTPLPKAKDAFSFAIHSHVETPDPPPTTLQDDPTRVQPRIPSLVTQLLVGCRRRAVIYRWKDGELLDVREAPQPHSARVIVFIDKDTACFAYTATDFAMFSIPTMTATDITTPIVVSSSGAAMNALSGLTGYMTLGLGAKAKPAEVQVSDTEVLISKDGQGHFVGVDGKTSRTSYVDWPVPPEEISFVKPYILSVLPAGSVPTRATDTISVSPAAAAQTAFNSTSLIQIRSSLSLQTCQSLSYPFDAPEATATQNATIRLLTSTPNAKSPLYMLTTPLDRTTAANEGSTLWSVSLKSWSEQLDELVLAGQYSDALDLLEIIEDDGSLPDKDQRRTKIKALNAVAQFRAKQFDTAIDTFIELDFNPAKVVALYPESVAGRLSVPPEGWIPLYGGPAPPVVESATDTSSEGDKDKEPVQERTAADLFDSVAAGGSLGGRFRKAGLAVLKGYKDDDAASITSKRRVGPPDDFHRSVETLVRYLSDRRPKLRAALEVVGITTESQSHLAAPLSEASLDDLFSLPNAPLSALTPNQLLRFAQIVDTALYKSYLIIRPALLGPLCRVANWCEVSEVEEDLYARKKFGELRDLYHGKKMHAKALGLLKELAEDEEDKEDKLDPSIQYLQKLGQDYIKLIFEHSRWLFDVDSDMAFQIFTSEDVELDRASVADYLESISPSLCAKYLEFIIAERSEHRTGFHDRLGELYLNITLAAKKRGDEKARQDMYRQFLDYIDTDQYFAIDRLYASVSAAGELHEARAILLGRLGRHDQALETYVYRLHDYHKAEEYCKRIYHPGGETNNIFFTLLRIYLRPTIKTDVDLLQPALDLISRHGPRLDAVETLQLLPPLVTMDDIKAFLVDALRAPVFDTAIVRHISKARSDQVARKLMGLQTRRVKITDSRICPQCHKRLGNSVIAVHAPRGEVTHYQCREAFSKRMLELRGPQ